MRKAMGVVAVLGLLGLTAPMTTTVHAVAGLTAAHQYHERGTPGVAYSWPHQAPAVGDLYGTGAINIVAAFPDGIVRAFDAAVTSNLWTANAGGQIVSSPTLADLYGDGRLETIVSTRGGAVIAYSPSGQVEPGFPVHSVDGGATGFPSDFFSSVAVGDLFNDGRKELVASSYDHYLYVWDASGQNVAGFPINLWDTAWDTPALIPNSSDPRQLDIVVGGDSSGPPTEPYPKGGAWYRFTNRGCGSVNGATGCQVAGWPQLIRQVPWSSPATYNVGGNTWNVVTGTGRYYGAPGAPGCLDAACGKQLTVYGPGGNTTAVLPQAAQVFSSPAVGNIGHGGDTVVATDYTDHVYADSAAGGQHWTTAPNGNATFSNPVIAPIDNSGTNGVWVGRGATLFALNGSDGSVAAQYAFGGGNGFAPGAPTVANLGGGLSVVDIGATTQAFNEWDMVVIPVPGNPQQLNPGSWPTFHGDMQRSGMAALTPSAPGRPTATAGDGSATVRWSPPFNPGASTVSSYTVTAYDRNGAIHGSTGPVSATNLSTAVGGLVNGQPYDFTVSAANSQGSGPQSVASFSVTPVSSTPPAPAASDSTASGAQYRLPNSDGATWQDVDPSTLGMTFTPPTDGTYLVTGNADLFTSSPGYNQDIGLCVYAGAGSCRPGSVVAWKESGGFAGVFSPNAAFVQQAITMTGGTAYTVKMVWKTNKPALGATIWAAAGGPGAFSPTRLSVRPLSAGASWAVSDVRQHVLANSDGRSWVPIDGTALALTVPAQGGAGQLVLGANADLFTNALGYNQDIGIQVNGGAYANQVVAWKESGGFAGAFSPNAAYVQSSIAVAAGTAYSVTLVWKTNIPSPGTIYDGAGGQAPFSPTTLVGSFVPDNHVQYKASQPITQYRMANNQNAWTPLGAGAEALTLTASPPGSTCLGVIGANADLWTDTGGYNQDIAIFVTPAGGTPALATWKESGGFGGTLSPNAAFAEVERPIAAGDVITVEWKTNRTSGATIYAGAGGAGNFSPTSVMVRYLGC